MDDELFVDLHTKVNMLIIDGVHSDELRSGQRKLLAASSWANAFEQRAVQLQKKLDMIVKEKDPPMVMCSVQDSEVQHGVLNSLALLQASSSQDLSLTSTISSDVSHVIQGHIDTGSAIPFLQTPPSVNKSVDPRAGSALPYSKVRRPLFKNTKRKGNLSDSRDEVLEVTMIQSSSHVGSTPTSKKRKP